MNEIQSAEREPRAGPLHQRPRLGGDGQLWLPVSSFVEKDGSVRIPAFHHVVDPFEHSDDELLLAESFARLDLDDHERVQGWFLFHGALDRDGFWDDPRASAKERPDGPVIDTPSDLALEQGHVRWLIPTLVLLSEHRLDGGWDRATVPVGQTRSVWTGHPGIDGVDALVGTWEGTVEFTRRLIEPYVTIALRREFGLEFQEAETKHGRRAVLHAWDWRVWRSILAPISLQVLDSLRRVSEGEIGAATCQQCGEGFLVLDGRRRRFCNERHRHRWTERQRRQRLKEQRAATPGTASQRTSDG